MRSPVPNHNRDLFSEFPQWREEEGNTHLSVLWWNGLIPSSLTRQQITPFAEASQLTKTIFIGEMGFFYSNSRSIVHYQFLLCRWPLLSNLIFCFHIDRILVLQSSLTSVLLFTHSSHQRRDDLFLFIDVEGEIEREIPHPPHFLLGNQTAGILQFHLVIFNGSHQGEDLMFPQQAVWASGWCVGWDKWFFLIPVLILRKPTWKRCKALSLKLFTQQ